MIPDIIMFNFKVKITRTPTFNVLILGYKSFDNCGGIETSRSKEDCMLRYRCRSG